MGWTQVESWVNGQSVKREVNRWSELQYDNNIFMNYQLLIECEIWWHLCGKFFGKDMRGLNVYNYVNL